MPGGQPQQRCQKSPTAQNTRQKWLQTNTPKRKHNEDAKEAPRDGAKQELHATTFIVISVEMERVINIKYFRFKIGGEEVNLHENRNFKHLFYYKHKQGKQLSRKGICRL